MSDAEEAYLALMENGAEKIGELTSDRNAWQARAVDATERLRLTAQIIIDAIGSVGPENADDAARRIVARLAEMKRQRDAALLDATEHAFNTMRFCDECAKNMAVHDVRWSDRHMVVCSAPDCVAKARHAAAHDGSGDRTDNPWFSPEWHDGLKVLDWPDKPAIRFALEVLERGWTLWWEVHPGVRGERHEVYLDAVFQLGIDDARKKLTAA